MKQNDIAELPNLDSENYENIFDIYQTENKLYYYNINKKINFPQNLPPSFYTTYNIGYGDTWPLISFKNYETPNLWWIIVLANGIQNPTQKLEPGTTLRIPVENVVREVLDAIQG